MERIHQFDPRYFTVYYAIDTAFTPADLCGALDTLERPIFLVCSGGGVRSTRPFAEQKKILQRCAVNSISAQRLRGASAQRC